MHLAMARAGGDEQRRMAMAKNAKKPHGQDDEDGVCSGGKVWA